ncbi:hypothetical protein SETIT_3G405600v2 [Setaria italica]|uniref:DUF1618 domain-containing protein n=1 Tax=Setaria italica TaxID=4555 RepID=A0A368QP77_SETIT|nr:hypothetical protein SETIT_3G405600v2 [Setaria italica]
MDEYVPCLDPPLLPTEVGGHLSPSSVILDDTAYISADAVSNATTAVGQMSTGAHHNPNPPPARLSYICVHFPGPDVGTVWTPPTHANLALLRVSIPGSLRVNKHCNFDYFVYAALTGFRRFRDQDAAIMRCPGGSRYVITVLRNILGHMEWSLQLYDSDTRGWTSKPLPPVEAPERDRVLPIPDSATEVLFHENTKVIVLESTTPVLRDMPLPKPARCNRGSFCKGDPYWHWDITVVTLPEQSQMSIKYVDRSSSSSDDDDVDDYWTATVWTMPVPIASWKDWHKDCTIDAASIAIDNPMHRELLPRLTVDPEEVSVTFSRLLTAHPTLGLGMNGDVVVYLLSKVDYRAREGWVIAVGTNSKLQGIAKLDDRKNFSLRRYYRSTDISKYLTKATELTILSSSTYIRNS